MLSSSPQDNAEIRVTPVALFQIIKDIRMGPSIPEARGTLYGLPADPAIPLSPIEVTSAFPEYSRKFANQKLSELQHDDYVEDVRKFTRDHLKDVKKLVIDTYGVGFYTSRNAGRRLAADDIRLLYDHQKEDPQSFCLVVVLDNSSISVRAFRISPSSLDYLERTDYFARAEPPHIDREMLFANLIVEVSVGYQLTPLEQMILQQMLGNFNLIADVFRLRDVATLQPEMRHFTDTMDELSDSLVKVADDQQRLSENREARAQWLRERRELNARRKAYNQPELPESAIDDEVPKERPCSKHPVIWHTYQYNAKSQALNAEVQEEQTKITALLALGRKD
jgi:hypothetical protein